MWSKEGESGVEGMKGVSTRWREVIDDFFQIQCFAISATCSGGEISLNQCSPVLSTYVARFAFVFASLPHNVMDSNKVNVE